MRKFALNNKKFDPPWPSEQPVVVVPPGVSPAAAGLPDQTLRRADTYDMFAETDISDADSAAPAPHFTDATEYKNDPNRTSWLMGEDFAPAHAHSSADFAVSADTPALAAPLGSVSLRSYLGAHENLNITVEFDSQCAVAVEKKGILTGVGNDFITMRDPSDNRTLICPIRNIRLIGIR